MKPMVDDRVRVGNNGTIGSTGTITSINEKLGSFSVDWDTKKNVNDEPHCYPLSFIGRHIMIESRIPKDENNPNTAFKRR